MIKAIPTRKELCKAYLKDKKSTLELAKIYTVSTATTRRWLISYNIPRRDQSEAHIKYEVPPREVLYDLYWTREKRVKGLMEQYGVSEGVIRRWFRIYAIPTKPWWKKVLHERNKSPEFRQLLSRKAKERWKKLSFEERKEKVQHLFKEDVRKRVFKSLLKKPTSIEKRFMEICKEQNFPFRYVGNGAILINGLNPDFINEEEKMIVEVLGEHWHTEEDVQRRQELFLNYGYKSLMIWQSELKNEKNLIQKVRKWSNVADDN